MAGRSLSAAVRGVVSKLYREWNGAVRSKASSFESLERRQMLADASWTIEVLDNGVAVQGVAASANTGDITVQVNTADAIAGGLFGTVTTDDSLSEADVLAEVLSIYNLSPYGDIQIKRAGSSLSTLGIASDQWVVALDDNDPGYTDDNDYNDAYVRVNLYREQAPDYVEEDPECHCNKPLPENISTEPIGYKDGQPRYTTVDLDSNGFDDYWGVSRSWSAKATGGNTGEGFVGTSLARATKIGDSYKVSYGSHAFSSYDFDGTNYVARFGALSKLQVAGSGTSTELIVQDSNGTVSRYFGFDAAIPAAQRGLLKSRVDAAGNATTATYDSTTFRLTQINRSTGSGSSQQQEAFDYSYYGSGVNAGQVSTIIHRQKIGSGSWADVRSVEYLYYDGSTANGNARQLERAVIRDGGLSAEVLDTKYYRYYAPLTISSISRTNYTSNGATATATVGSHEFQVGQMITLTGAPGAYGGTFKITAVSSTTISYKIGGSASETPASYSGSGMAVVGGAKGALKYVFDEHSYERLEENVSTPLTATDAAIAPYAMHYFEYDSMGRVTKEVAQGAGSASTGGLGTYTFSYQVSSFADGYNTWKYQTTETLPDGNQNIVYTNAFGQVIGKNFKEVATNKWWREYFRYDSEGREILHATSAAVKGFSPTYSDLVIFNESTGNATWLETSKGLIHLTEYATTTTATATTAGDVAGYVKSTSIKRGTATTPVLQSSRTYFSRTDGDGNTIYPIASETRYRNTNGTGGQTTTVAYTWHGTTNQIATQTATMPVVTTAQNGPNTAQTETTYFDTYGRAIWVIDGEGYITYNAYDSKTGAMTLQISDADPSLISGAAVTGPTRSGSLPTALHLETAMEVDTLGRVTKVTDPEGRVTYTVYNDADHEVRTYVGWNPNTGTATGPTIVRREARHHNYSEYLTMSATPDVTGSSGSYVPTGAEAISDLESLSRTFTNFAGQTIETREYFDLIGVTYSTAASLGTLDVNFYSTTYAYDSRGRQNRVENANGTITRTVYDAPGRVASTWIGTDDTGATNGDPDGSGSPNNMRKVAEYEYDNGGIGNGLLTAVTRIPGGSAANRVSRNYYDWRDRLVASKSAVEASESTSDNTHFVSYTDYDNLSQAIASYTYDGDGVTITTTNGVPNKPSASLLRAKSGSEYDEQGRVFRSTTYAVNPSNGAVDSTGLVSQSWFNLRGQTIKSTSTGSATQKMQYDGAGRTLKSFVTDAGGDSGWSDADDVTGDIVLEQVEYVYDGSSNVIQTIARQRFHDATDTGELGNPSSSSGTAKARVSYSGSYYDLAGRVTDSVTVGTNGGSVWSRPSTVPSRSDTVLVTSYGYDEAGRTQSVTDPRGIVTYSEYDDLGRTTRTIEAYTDGVPTDSTNRITAYTYDGLGRTTTVKAVLPDGPDADTNYDLQQTKYIFGATVVRGDGIDSNDVMIAVRYPDKTTGYASTSEEELFTSNAVGETTSKEDRNGNVRTFTYDVLSRLTSDAVTTLGSGVDGAIRRVGTTFNTQGLVDTITSYDASSGGNVVNQVQRTYNGFGQMLIEYQAHDGAVNTSTTPKVQYGYSSVADGSRFTLMTYPNGRQLTYNYAAGLNSTISRLSSIADGSTTLEAYTYLGLGSVVQRLHPENGINLTYVGTGTGDAGDQYTGLDRFGRVVDHKWTDSSSAVDQYLYAYDRNSNRVSKDNALHSPFNEDYTYDNLNRLTDTLRNGAAYQAWDLDALGNSNSVTTSGVTENRTHNYQNQLTGMGSSTLAFDANGNTTTDQNGRTLVYDAWNRLVEAKSGSTSLTRYEYDGLTRRIEEGSTDQYFSAAWQVLEEQNGSTGDTIASYAWSPVYVDAMIVRDRDSDSSGSLDERLYVLQDANFNVTAIADTSGDIVERYLFDPYGQRTILDPNFSADADNASDFAFMHGHQGGKYDSVLMNQMLFRNRVYDVETMRWMQQDPAGYVDGVSMYASLGGNPIGYVDPLGLEYLPDLLFPGADPSLEALQDLKAEEAKFGAMHGMKLSGNTHYTYQKASWLVSRDQASAFRDRLWALVQDFSGLPAQHAVAKLFDGEAVGRYASFQIPGVTGMLADVPNDNPFYVRLFRTGPYEMSAVTLGGHPLSGIRKWWVTYDAFEAEGTFFAGESGPDCGVWISVETEAYDNDNGWTNWLNRNNGVLDVVTSAQLGIWKDWFVNLDARLTGQLRFKLGTPVFGSGSKDGDNPLAGPIAKASSDDLARAAGKRR